jgi:purine-binding chemotaxis protein CheW
VTTLRLLLFRCGEQVFAVEAAVVREIIAAPASTRIPGAPAAVQGLVNVRGTLVPVVDTATAIGLEAEGARGSLVLVERNGRTVALAVDEVLDLVTVPSDALGDRAQLPGVRPDLVRAVGAVAGHDFVHLATDALLEPLLP